MFGALPVGQWMEAYITIPLLVCRELLDVRLKNGVLASRDHVNIDKQVRDHQSRRWVSEECLEEKSRSR